MTTAQKLNFLVDNRQFFYTDEGELQGADELLAILLGRRVEYDEAVSYLKQKGAERFIHKITRKRVEKL